MEEASSLIGQTISRFRLVEKHGVELFMKADTAIAAKESKKYAHPVCSCTVTAGKYCSVECEAMEKTPDLACECGRAGCRGL
jgi:hypothetical protein